MYVCICNAIRESDLRQVCRQTCGDAESCYAQLGKVPQCRQCLEEAEWVLEEERSQASGLNLIAA